MDLKDFLEVFDGLDVKIGSIDAIVGAVLSARKWDSKSSLDLLKGFSAFASERCSLLDRPADFESDIPLYLMVCGMRWFVNSGAHFNTSLQYSEVFRTISELSVHILGFTAPTIHSHVHNAVASLFCAIYGVSEGDLRGEMHTHLIAIVALLGSQPINAATDSSQIRDLTTSVWLVAKLLHASPELAFDRVPMTDLTLLLQHALSCPLSRECRQAGSKLLLPAFLNALLHLLPAEVNPVLTAVFRFFSDYFARNAIDVTGAFVSSEERVLEDILHVAETVMDRILQEENSAGTSVSLAEFARNADLWNLAHVAMSNEFKPTRNGLHLLQRLVTIVSSQVVEDKPEAEEKRSPNAAPIVARCGLVLYNPFEAKLLSLSKRVWTSYFRIFEGLLSRQFHILVPLWTFFEQVVQHRTQYGQRCLISEPWVLALLRLAIRSHETHTQHYCVRKIVRDTSVFELLNSELVYVDLIAVCERQFASEEGKPEHSKRDVRNVHKVLKGKDNGLSNTDARTLYDQILDLVARFAAIQATKSGLLETLRHLMAAAQRQSNSRTRASLYEIAAALGCRQEGNRDLLIGPDGLEDGGPGRRRLCKAPRDVLCNSDIAALGAIKHSIVGHAPGPSTFRIWKSVLRILLQNTTPRAVVGSLALPDSTQLSLPSLKHVLGIVFLAYDAMPAFTSQICVEWLREHKANKPDDTSSPSFMSLYVKKSLGEVLQSRFSAVTQVDVDEAIKVAASAGSESAAEGPEPPMSPGNGFSGTDISAVVAAGPGISEVPLLALWTGVVFQAEAAAAAEEKEGDREEGEIAASRMKSMEPGLLANRSRLLDVEVLMPLLRNFEKLSGHPYASLALKRDSVQFFAQLLRLLQKGTFPAVHKAIAEHYRTFLDCLLALAEASAASASHSNEEIEFVLEGLSCLGVLCDLCGAMVTQDHHLPATTAKLQGFVGSFLDLVQSGESRGQSLVIVLIALSVALPALATLAGRGGQFLHFPADVTRLLLMYPNPSRQALGLVDFPKLAVRMGNLMTMAKFRVAAAIEASFAGPAESISGRWQAEDAKMILARIAEALECGSKLLSTQLHSSAPVILSRIAASCKGNISQLAPEFVSVITSGLNDVVSLATSLPNLVYSYLRILLNPDLFCHEEIGPAVVESALRLVSKKSQVGRARLPLTSQLCLVALETPKLVAFLHPLIYELASSDSLLQAKDDGNSLSFYLDEHGDFLDGILGNEVSAKIRNEWGSPAGKISADVFQRLLLLETITQIGKRLESGYYQRQDQKVDVGAEKGAASLIDGLFAWATSRALSFDKKKKIDKKASSYIVPFTRQWQLVACASPFVSEKASAQFFEDLPEVLDCYGASIIRQQIELTSSVLATRFPPTVVPTTLRALDGLMRTTDQRGPISHLFALGYFIELGDLEHVRRFGAEIITSVSPWILHHLTTVRVLVCLVYYLLRERLGGGAALAQLVSSPFVDAVELFMTTNPDNIKLMRGQERTFRGQPIRERCSPKSLLKAEIEGVFWDQELIIQSLLDRSRTITPQSKENARSGSQRQFYESLEQMEESENFQIKIADESASIENVDQDLILIASLVKNVPNLGGITRTCEVFRTKSVTFDDLRVLRTSDFANLSMTAEKWVNAEEVRANDIPAFIAKCRTDGYSIIGLEQTANSISLDEFEFPKKAVVLLGDEKMGTPHSLINLVDFCVEIPQRGKIKSLNVHVSAAIMIWEYTRQALTQKRGGRKER